MPFLSSHRPGVRRQPYTGIGMTLAATIFVTFISVDLSLATPQSSECSNSYLETSAPISEDSQGTYEKRRCSSRCDGVCYNPYVHACVDGKLDCSCLAKCNEECYNPERWDCVEDRLCPKHQILCRVNEDLLKCYDRILYSCTCPTDKFCIWERLDKPNCNQNELPCNGMCHDPLKGSCNETFSVGNWIVQYFDGEREESFPAMAAAVADIESTKCTTPGHEKDLNGNCHPVMVFKGVSGSADVKVDEGEDFD